MKVKITTDRNASSCGCRRAALLPEARTMKCIALLAAVAVLCGSAGAARADMIYSNFGPGQTYSLTGYSVSGGVSGSPGPPNGFGFAIAESFTPSGDFLFGSAELPLVYLSGPNDFTVALMTDAGGQPGTILESFSLTDAPPYSSPGVSTFVSTTNTPLDAGTTYWIVAIPGDRNTAGYWLANSTGPTGFMRTGNDGVTWSTDPQASPALEVDGTPVAPVPEPPSFALLGVGLAALAAWRWVRCGRA
jgi:hypothetical protein